MVDVRGVKFPAYIDQLDFPYFKRFTEKKAIPKKDKKYIEDVRKEKAPAPKVADGVWLSFLPKMDTDEFGDDVVEHLKIHLINRTERALQFIYRLQFFGGTEFELKNVIQPFTDFYVHDVPFEDMSDSPNFNVEFSLVQPEKRKADYFETNLKLKPKQLFAKIEEIKQKGVATFSYLLFEHYPDKKEEAPLDLGSLAAKGIKIYNAKEVRRHLPPARTVIDLHIEKLTDEWQHLSNGEIVIHGVGSGRLRDEIHDALRLKREVKSFVNQYNPSFGYGATEIYFQY
jgi:hypothetical protein